MKYELKCGECGGEIRSDKCPSLDQIPHIDSCPMHRERLSEKAPKGEAIV